MGEREQNQILLRTLSLCVDDGEDILSYPTAFEKVFALGYQRRGGDLRWIGVKLKISEAGLFSPVGVGELRKAAGILHFVQNDAAGGEEDWHDLHSFQITTGMKFGIVRHAGSNLHLAE